MKRLALGLAALVAVVGIAAAAGNFPGFPIVGKATYCQGTSTGATGNAACTVNVPAGPSIIPAGSLIPADTQLANGAQPQTVLVGLASLNALPVTVATVVSAANSTLTATNLTGGYILHSTGTISQVTINLPPSPADGQQFVLSSDQTTNASGIIMVATSPATVDHSPTIITTSAVISYGYRFMYNAALTKWLRLQ